MRDETTIRDRDLLGEGCILCGLIALQEFLDDEVICAVCFAVFPRWMTKGEIAEIQANEGVQE